MPASAVQLCIVQRLQQLPDGYDDTRWLVSLPLATCVMAVGTGQEG